MALRMIDDDVISCASLHTKNVYLARTANLVETISLAPLYVAIPQTFARYWSS